MRTVCGRRRKGGRKQPTGGILGSLGNDRMVRRGAPTCHAGSCPSRAASRPSDFPAINSQLGRRGEALTGLDNANQQEEKVYAVQHTGGRETEEGAPRFCRRQLAEISFSRSLGCDLSSLLLLLGAQEGVEGWTSGAREGATTRHTNGSYDSRPSHLPPQRI